MDTFVPKAPGHSEMLLLQAFARLDARALGVAVGVWFGSGVFAASIVLLIQGGSPVGPNLGLLSQYFIGYTVTWGGSLVGFAYGFVCGFVLGWLVAFLRNVAVSLYLQNVRFKSAMSAVSDFVNRE